MNYLLDISIYAALIAFVVNIIISPFLIPLLKKLKFGQYVRDDGPQTHLQKTGTPTMGGIIILSSFLVAGLFFIKGSSEGLAVILITLAYGILGFIDDYLKVVKKQSMGLRAYQKMIAQFIITSGFVFYMVKYTNIGTEVFIPFTDARTINLGILFIPFVFFIMIGTVNSVNLTDGLDGLASGVTALVSVFFLVICWANNSSITPIAGAALGSLLGFLLFNSYPARIFMGDTGSLALGGFVATVAILLKVPLLLGIVGIIYVVEAMSVIIQVSYYKRTKKRIFKMAPLHHHFEQMGWSESKVVAVFYVVTAIMCLVGLLGAKSLFN